MNVLHQNCLPSYVSLSHPPGASGCWIVTYLEPTDRMLQQFTRFNSQFAHSHNFTEISTAGLWRLSDLLYCQTLASRNTLQWNDLVLVKFPTTQELIREEWIIYDCERMSTNSKKSNYPAMHVASRRTYNHFKQHHIDANRGNRVEGIQCGEGSI